MDEHPLPFLSCLFAPDFLDIFQLGAHAHEEGIGDDEGGHGFYNDYGTGDDDGVVAAFDLAGDVFARTVDGVLGGGDGRCRFDGGA